VTFESYLSEGQAQIQIFSSSAIEASAIIIQHQDVLKQQRRGWVGWGYYTMGGKRGKGLQSFYSELPLCFNISTSLKGIYFYHYLVHRKSQGCHCPVRR